MKRNFMCNDRNNGICYFITKHGTHNLKNENNL